MCGAQHPSSSPRFSGRKQRMMASAAVALIQTEMTGKSLHPDPLLLMGSQAPFLDINKMDINRKDFRSTTAIGMLQNSGSSKHGLSLAQFCEIFSLFLILETGE